VSRSGPLQSEMFVPAPLPLALRTDLMLMPADTELEQHAGFLVVRSPRNPNHWWGNHLYFERPPARGDLERWPRAFAQHIRALQPASRHTAFSWAGTEAGLVGPFRRRGYVVLDSIVLSTSAPGTYPHANHEATIRVLAGDDWDMLLALLVAERGPEHPLASYKSYALGRIEQWRARAEAGLGAWYGAYFNGDLASTLGLFVSASTDASGQRLARFQEVVTAPRYRKQGLAGTLVAAACTDMRRRFGALRFVIVADENDVAQRIYRSLGFEVVEYYKGLEKGGY
jgi:ribosomal protein S18 acetylase RimI-like enzyme